MKSKQKKNSGIPSGQEIVVALKKGHPVTRSKIFGVFNGMRVKITIGILFFITMAMGCSLAEGLPVVFKSKGMEVTVDRERGRILSIQNHLVGARYDLVEDNCRLVFDGGVIDLSKVPMKLTQEADGKLTFVGTALGVEISRIYTMPVGRDYFNRELIIKNKTKTPLVLKTIEDASLVFNKGFQVVHYHNDGMNESELGRERSYESPPGQPSVYRCALNVFLRDKQGGLFVGLKYPYWKLIENEKKDRVLLAYEANYRLKPDETLQLPTMFLGAYKNSGFTCRKDLHWKPRLLITEQEEMDWGEVWAMRKVLRDYLPKQTGPAAGYYITLSSWWAILGAENRAEMNGRFTEKSAKLYCELLDRVKQSRCLDAMCTAPVWVGWTGFIRPCPEIEAVGPDAVFPHNPWIDQVVGHAKKIGVKLFSFSEPNTVSRQYRKDRPDWKVQPSPDSDKRLLQNCHANPEYEDWHYRLVSSAIDTCGLCGWVWDHSWVRRPMICYGQIHGHEPGNCEFQQYRNVTNLILRLREHYPDGIFDICWGLKEAGSWAHCGLNSLENIYENASPSPPGMSRGDDQRFQVWYNHNYRFLPTYINLAQINFKKKEVNGHLYSILSALQASTHARLTEFPAFATDAEAEQVFKDLRYWKDWATKHMDYLEDRVDLFGQPCRKGGIDGSAHIIGDRGYIFVFNPWPGEDKWGSIPLNELIGIKNGDCFSLDEISSGTPKRLGVCKTGDNFLFPIAAKTAMLIELKPTLETVNRVEPPEGTPVQPAFSK